MRRLPTSTRTLGSRFDISAHKRLAATFAIVAAIAVAAIAILLLLRPFDVVHAELIQGGLDHPWDIAFTDDGRMLVTERIGRVRVYASGEPGASLLHTATIPDVRAELESGLMGIAVHHDAVFVCASRDPGGDWKVELLRSTLAADGSLAPFEVVPIGPTSGAPRHQGCALEVDGSDHIWLTIGDANLPVGENPAQDPDRLNGKVLRVDLDGSAPTDNPFGNAVYSLGHRNPRGWPSRPTAPSGRSSTAPMRTTRSTSSSRAAITATRASPAPMPPDRSQTAADPPPTTWHPPGRPAPPPSPPPAPRSSSVLAGEIGRATSSSARSRRPTCDASRSAPMTRSPSRRRCSTIGSAGYAPS